MPKIIGELIPPSPDDTIIFGEASRFRGAWFTVQNRTDIKIPAAALRDGQKIYEIDTDSFLAWDSVAADWVSDTSIAVDLSGYWTAVESQSAIDDAIEAHEGTNTHAQIDAHLADNTKHRVINDAANNDTELWSALKINQELLSKQNALTIDPTPIDGSSNPVESNGIFDALQTKEPTITATTDVDYYRGDKTFQPLNKAAVGLDLVDNTSDADKPISTSVQSALNDKADSTEITSLQNALSDKANSDNVLALDNTTPYTPSLDYHPATQKYVLDSLGGLGGGDMLKSTYDANDNGKVDSAELADDSSLLDGQNGAHYLSRANHTGTQTAATISDFQSGVSANSDVTDNTAARHDAVTLGTIGDGLNVTLNQQAISADLADSGTAGDYNYITTDAKGRVTTGLLKDYLTLSAPSNGLSHIAGELSLSLATTSESGAMSAADKTKLDATASDSDLTTHTGDATIHFTTGEIDTRITTHTNNADAHHDAVTLGASSNGLGLTDQALSLSLATTSESGAMSADDKKKLDSNWFDLQFWGGM